IEVTDTGVGIPPDKIDKIFDKFTQADSSVSRHYGGSGLGLAIAKAFAEMMQGAITVQSKPGAGSTFTVTLPLPLHATGAAEEQPAPARSAPNDRQRHSILLVEDYAPNALVATAFLEQLGYRYDTAGSGAQAIEKLLQGKFDAVLMDIQMPGMDGFETTRTIRREEAQAGRPRLRIIGLTAHATFADRDKCFAAGMDDFLAKPFRLEDLREKLSDQLGAAELS
ncbi:MAG TPA: response regulator, partial [Patescibacteria group bacterium]|nr:response regulator [Patescibacteria group bacterium]